MASIEAREGLSNTMWHINPDTGDVGKCGAIYSCPFSGISNHTKTKTEARKNYEDFSEAILDSEGDAYFFHISDKDSEAFTQGDCGIFADELHRATGWPQVLIGENGPDGEFEHIAVRAPDGRILDVTGIQSESTIKKAWAEHMGFKNGTKVIPLIGSWRKEFGYADDFQGSSKIDPAPVVRGILKMMESFGIAIR